MILVIELQNISWKRDNHNLLNNINWLVEKGQHWAIVGLNGSGKTTLLNIINGYLWPTAGEAKVLGFKFGETDLRELRKHIGWVSSSLQEKLYNNETAEAIVLSGKYGTIGLYQKPEQFDLEQAHQVMETMGCLPLVQKTYKTLSQGEKQKVLIARALISSPKLLILDEPCNGLDVFSREQLLEIIGHLASKESAPTLLYVTHHLEEILPIFSHTLLLRSGKIHSAGKTEDILNGDNLSEFFKVPVQIALKGGRHWITF